MENTDIKEVNESDGDLNFTVTYCGAEVPLNPFVTLESMEENLNATANVKDKVLVCNHDTINYGGYRGNINGDNLRRRKIVYKPIEDDTDVSSETLINTHRRLPREYADESYSMNSHYAGPIPVLADQNTLKPQVVKLQGEFDFDAPSIATENQRSSDADGWNEALFGIFPNESQTQKKRNSKSMENDRKNRRKKSKLQNHNVEVTDAAFKADDGSKFTLDDLYIPPPRDVESSIIEARSIMQNHIDKQYDIMEENKRSLRRRLDKRRNESESKRPGTSSEEESTEEKEGDDTTSSLDSEDEELPPLGHGDRVEAEHFAKDKGTGSIIKVNHRKQTYNIL